MTDTDAGAGRPFRKDGTNFFLIGFMGSGKSFWGKKWAAANQLSFVDLDALIEKKERKTIDEIFQANGENYFRNAEATALRECIQLQDTIIACGGGTPCFYGNIQWMNSHGITIYISCTPDQVKRRIWPEKEKRPLIKKLKEEELLSYITEKLEERIPFYSQAKLTLQSGNLSDESFSHIISNAIS